MKHTPQPAKPYLIYVPGLGDQRSLGQISAIKAWRSVGVKAEYYAVGWADGEPFEPKMRRLKELVDKRFAEHGPVVLMGASAGASAVLNVAAAMPKKIRAIVSICGFVRNANLQDQVFADNPAFGDSMRLLPASLLFLEQRAIPILSVNSVHDKRVPRVNTQIPGAQSITMPMVGHVQTIAYSITLGKHRIARFIHRTAQSSVTLSV